MSDRDIKNAIYRLYVACNMDPNKLAILVDRVLTNEGFEYSGLHSRWIPRRVPRKIQKEKLG